MKVSIIIPCYNEESTIKEIINKINSETSIEKEIIVIDKKSKKFNLKNKIVCIENADPGYDFIFSYNCTDRSYSRII